MNTLSLEAARLERQRWWTLIAYGAIWFVWQTLTLPPVEAFLARRGLPMAIIGPALMTAWFASLVLLILVLARVHHDRRLRGVLNDELSRVNWLRAASAGYYVLLVALAVVAVAAQSHWLDMRTAFLTLIMIAVGVPLGVNIWLERDTGER